MRYGLDSLAEVHWICNGLREKDFGHFCIFECESSESNLKAHPSASAENVLGNANKFSGKKHYNRKPVQRGRSNRGGGVHTPKLQSL